MKDSWILVTGGSRGIGAAIVNELCMDHNIVFTSRSLKSVKDENAVQDKPFVKQVVCDSCQNEEVKAIANQLTECYGPPSVVIHNAGVTLDDLHIHQSVEQWRNVIDTNLNSIFYWNKYLLPGMMAKSGGTILIVSSVTGLKGNIGQTAYGASKAALFGLTRSLALEVARFGIRINCLAPGVIDTEMTQRLSPEAMKKLRSKIPLRRTGTAEEVAKVARFMISESCGYMTGQTLVLDGGMTA
ncbi:SDR family NAD(P)-dependent oxidoreductase [Enterobacter pseudoroggenkampii]|uniref:SDR family NAD(P)-dependent oxidoreductase n=1 Tax=Enterobacter pseudoroggenkampii TaxID=2996112 RepID=UPI002940847B|nr:SDR family oxidoreductase [Citrobacter amalonaticus]